MKQPGVSKIWRDPVWSTVIAAAIIAAASYFAGYWPAIWRAAVRLPHILGAQVSIPIWGLVVAIPALLFIIPAMAKLRTEKEHKPSFLSYTSDRLFEIDWSWRWTGPDFFTKSYDIEDLVPRCPSCHAALSVTDYGGKLVTCINENCTWQWERQNNGSSRIRDSGTLKSRVINEIDRRLHAGECG